MQLWKKNLLFVWLSQICSLAGFASIMPFIPLYIKWKFGVTDEGELGVQVALFNFFGTMAYAIFCPIWGKLSDRFGVKPMLLRGTFVTCLIFPLMPYATTLENSDGTKSKHYLSRGILAELVKELQDYITDHYYTCTKQILKGLGMMYIAGDEMTANIDAAGGKGTAQFAHEAIEIYCQ